MPKRADWNNQISRNIHTLLTENNFYYSPNSKYIYLNRNFLLNVKSNADVLILKLNCRTDYGIFKTVLTINVTIKRDIVKIISTTQDGKSHHIELTTGVKPINIQSESKSVALYIFKQIEDYINYQSYAYINYQSYTEGRRNLVTQDYVRLIEADLSSKLSTQGYPVQSKGIYFQLPTAPQVISVDRQEYLITVVGTNRETSQVTYAYRILVRERVATVQDFSDNYPITKEQRDLITKPLPQTNNPLVAHTFVDKFVSTLLQVLPPRF